jgi:nucleotide-binding universal stress UspA family protein
MTETQQTGDYRRVLIALDASPESLAALNAAARLAARLEAELTGLFVEDIDLLNLAGLPFAREATAFSLASRSLDAAAVERELKTRAAAARRALSSVAESLHLRWSFRVTRGRVEAELLAAAQEADLVAVGRGMRPLSGRAKLGRTALAVASGTTRSILVAASRSAPSDAPIAVAFDASEGSKRALATAARLAQRDDRKLIVLVTGDTDETLSQREIEVTQRLRDIGVGAATLRPVRSADIGDLVRALAGEGISLFVSCAGGVASELGTFGALVERSACSILLVRG